MPHSQFRRAEQAPSDEEGEDLEPLEDKTEALTLRSKKDEPGAKEAAASRGQEAGQTRPARPAARSPVRASAGDLVPAAAQRPLQPAPRGQGLRRLHYCFRLPVLIRDIQQQQRRINGDHNEDGQNEEADDIDIVPILQSPERQDRLGIHKRPYSHVPPPDPAEVCTCLTCVLRWSALCLIVDFAHWQDDLDRGEPLPTWSRREPVPEWNRQLLARNADVVRKALSLHRDGAPRGAVAGSESVGGLWHARLLEAHLDSTTRANRRHAANKGNKRRRFQMSAADAAVGTDAFLARSGPPTFDFPFHRDNYYMLEAYLPNRAWIENKAKWVYVPASQHDYDIQQVMRWAVDMRGTRGRAVVEEASDQGQVAATT
ncbi:uncharacterized protein PG986_004060 [Apiospora aurea]|uniref:Uncharacterized protein n=1 Tax=Apiospora aurea TaxID=335848 RepID=A0ABR1QLI7_9PEZI